MPDKFKIFNRIRYSLIGVFAAVLIAAVIIFAAGFIGSPVVASASDTEWASFTSVALNTETDTSGIQMVDTNIYPQTTIAQLKEKLVVTGTYFDVQEEKTLTISSEVDSDDYTISVSFDGSTYTAYSDTDTPFSDITDTESDTTVYIRVIAANDKTVYRDYTGSVTVPSSTTFSSGYTLALREKDANGDATTIYTDTTMEMLRTLLVLKDSSGTTIVYGDTSYLAAELVTIKTSSQSEDYPFNQGDSVTNTITLTVTYYNGTGFTTRDYTMTVAGSAVQNYKISSFEVAVDGKGTYSGTTLYQSGNYYYRDDSHHYYAFTSNLESSDVLKQLKLTLVTAGGAENTYAYNGTSYTLSIDASSVSEYQNISSNKSVTLTFKLTTSNDSSFALYNTATIYFVKYAPYKVTVSYTQTATVYPYNSYTALAGDYTVNVDYNDGNVYNSGNPSSYSSAEYGTMFTIDTDFAPKSSSDLSADTYTGSFTVTTVETPSKTSSSVSVTITNSTTYKLSSASLSVSTDSATQTLYKDFDYSATVVTLTYSNGKASYPVYMTLGESKNLFNSITVYYYSSYDENEGTGTTQKDDDGNEIKYMLFSTVAVEIEAKITINGTETSIWATYVKSNGDYIVYQMYKYAPTLDTTNSEYYKSKDEGGVSLTFSNYGENSTSNFSFDSDMAITSILLNGTEVFKNLTETSTSTDEDSYTTTILSNNYVAVTTITDSNGDVTSCTVTFYAAGTFKIYVTLTAGSSGDYRWSATTGASTSSYSSTYEISYSYTVLPQNPPTPVVWVNGGEGWTYGQGNSTTLVTAFDGNSYKYSYYGYTTVNFYITGTSNDGTVYSAVQYAYITFGNTEEDGYASETVTLYGDFATTALGAGTYQIYVTLSGSTNYADYTGNTSTFTVARQKVTVQVTGDGSIEVEYSGTDYLSSLYDYITVYGNVYELDEDGNGGIAYNGTYNTESHNIWSYSVAEGIESVKNVGSYTITITLKDTANFYWDHESDTEEFTFKVTSFQSAFSSESMKDISYLSSASAGSATLNVYSNTDYRSDSAPYSTIYLSSDTWDRLQKDCTDVDKLVSALAELTADSDTGVYSLEGLSTADVGTYYAVFYIAAEKDYANYTAAYGAVDFEIEKLTVGVSSDAQNGYTTVYDGSAHEYTVNISSGDANVTTLTESTYWQGNGVDWQVSITYGDTTTTSTTAAVSYENAGTYTVTFTLADTKNYVLVTNEYGSTTYFTITITVKKATVALPTLTDDATTAGSASVGETLTYTYNGKEQTASISGSGDGATITSSLVEVYLGEDKQDALQVSVTTAGSYSVSVQLADAANYCWYGETVTDFTTRTSADTAKSFTITVQKQGITKPTANSETYTYKYNASTYAGESQTYVVNNLATSQIGQTDGVIKVTLEGTSIYDINNLTETNAGTYTIVITLADSANYTWGSDGDNDISTITISWEIAKASVTDVTLSATSLTFDPEGQTITINDYLSAIMTSAVTESSGFSVSGNTVSVLNQGNYSVTVSFSDTNGTNFKWNTQGNSESITLTFNVAQLAVAEPTAATVMYNGTTQTATLSGDDYTKYSSAYTVSGNSQKDADTYTITITLDSNYTWKDGSDGNVSWTITPYSITKPGNFNGTYTYNGKSQTISITNWVSNAANLGGYTVTISSATAPDASTIDSTSYETSSTNGTVTVLHAGTYTVTIGLTNSNFAWDDSSTESVSITLSVSAKSVTAPTGIGTAKTYDGTAQTLTMTTWDTAAVALNGLKIEVTGKTIAGVDNSILSGAISSSLADGTVTATYAGNYTVTVSLTSADFVWSGGGTTAVSLEFTITQAALTVVWTNSTPYTYNGSAQAPTAAATTNNYNNITFSVSVEAQSGSSLDDDDNAVNVGSYTAKATFADSNYSFNYTYSNASANFTIQAITITSSNVTFSNTTQTYSNGTALTPDYTISNKVSGEDVTFTFDKYPTTAGTYTLTVSLASTTVNANYVIDGTISTSFTISPKTVTAPALGEEGGRTITYAQNTAQVPWVFDSSKEGYYQNCTITIEDDWTITYTVSYMTSSDEGQTLTSTDADKIINKSNYYYAVLTLSDSTNYVWASNSSDSSCIENYQLTSDVIDDDAGTITINFRISNASFSLTITVSGETYYGDSNTKGVLNYTGLPSNYSEGSKQGEITTTYYYEGGTKVSSDDLIDGVPYKAGTYYAVISWTETDNYSSGQSTSSTFTISPYVLKYVTDDADSQDFSWANVSFTYDTTDHSMADETTQYAFATLTKSFSNVAIYSISFTYTLTLNGETVSSMTDAGEYTVTISAILDNGTKTNNIVLGDSKTYTYSTTVTVNRATVATPVLDNTSFDYNSSSHTSTVGSSGSDYNYGIASAYVNVYLGNNDTAEDGLSVSVQNAGYYSVRVELKNKDNYCWLGDTVNAFGEENYSSDVTLYITVKKATVSTPELDTDTFTYNAAAQTATIKNTDASGYNYNIDTSYVKVYLDGAEQTDSISVSVTDAGTYTVTVELKDTDNYCWLGEETDPTESGYTASSTKELTLIVKKATVSTPKLDTSTFTYNATAQTATIKNTDASGYNYNIDTSYVKVYLDGAEQTDSISVSVTDAGTYTVTVELKDTDNYCWLGEETDPAAGGYATSGSKTLTIKVEKRAITVTITSISSVYGESLTDKAYTVTDGATDYTNLSTMVLDDIKSAIASHITLTHSVEVGTSVGTYVITGSVVSDSDTDKNYNVVFAGDWATEDNNYQKAGTYTVTVRPITVSISDGESVYGNDLESTTAVTIKVANDSTYQLYTADTASNVYGYIITNSSTKGSGTEIDKTYDKGTYYIYGDSNNGNYSITWSYTTVGEYSTYTISARPVAIKVTDTSSTYGSSSYDTAITWQYADDSATFVNPNSSVSEIEKNATTVYDKKADSGYDVSLTTTAVASSDVASYITYLVIGSYSGATYTKNTTYAAGTYTIEMSNYTVTVYIGEHVVKQRAVEITVSGATTTYGDLLATSSLNWSYNSTNKFLTPSGETVSDIEVNAEKIYDTANGGTKDITLATTALQSSDVESYITYLTIADGTASTTYSSNEATYGEGGYYTITMSNYTVKVNIGEHVVEKRTVSVSVTGTTSTYGNSNYDTALSWSYGSGSRVFVTPAADGSVTDIEANAEKIYDTLNGGAKNIALNSTASQSSVVGSYITYLTIGGSDGVYSSDEKYSSLSVTYYTINLTNYTVSVTVGEHVVNKRSITVTIADVTAVYGTVTAQSALTAEVTTNAYDEETETLYTLSANDKVLAGTENVGTYKISATTSDYGKANYNITYAGNYDDEVKGGKFDVTQATLIITPDADSVTYGDDFTASKYTVSGWKNSDGDEGLSTLTVTFGYVTGYEYSQGSPVSGTYTIIITDDKNTKGVVSSDADITNNYYFVYNSDTSGEDPNKTTVDSDKFSAALTVNAREITITFDNKVLYYNLNSSYSYGKQTFAYYGTEGASAGASGYGYTWTAAVTNSSNSSSDAIFSTDYWYTLFTISGGIKTWSDTDLNTADALTTTALTTYDADSSNPYTITGTATGNDGYDASGNYLITFKTATFTINPAQLEINMDGPGNSVYDGTAKVYKATDASGTATFTPVYYRVNDDGTRTLLGEDGKEAPIDVGSYAVTFSATSSTNYQAAGSGTTFNITQATLSVSFTYTWSNDANTAITTTAQYSGYALVATPTFTGICTVRDTADSLNYTITYTGENATDGSAINAGDYTITLTINNGNYFFADTTDSSSASFNIAKQQVSSPVLEKTSDTYQGIQLSFDIATYNTGTDANTGANVLTPALSASSDALEATANLSATAADGVLTVYITNAGTYTVSVTLTNTDNYVWAEGTGAKEYTITINKAALTLTVANQSIIYGEVLSTTAYSFEYTGWVGDDKTSGASSAVVGISNTTQVMGDVVYVVTTYTPSTAAGTSGITISVVTDDPEGLTSTNYTLNVTTGTLTVDKRPITITVNNYSSTYTGDNQTSAMQAAVLADLSTYFEVADGAFGSSGDALSSLGIKFANTSATATNAGDYTFTFTTETDTNTNNYTVTFLNVNAQGDNAKNYLLFTIEQATLYVYVENYTVTYGDSVDGVFTMYYSEEEGHSFVNSETESTAAKTTTSTSNTYSTVLVGGSDSYAAWTSYVGQTYTINYTPYTFSNYDVTVIPGTLTIKAREITLDSFDGEDAGGYYYSNVFTSGDTKPITNTGVAQDANVAFSGDESKITASDYALSYTGSSNDGSYSSGTPSQAGTYAVTVTLAQNAGGSYNYAFASGSTGYTSSTTATVTYYIQKATITAAWNSESVGIDSAGASTVGTNVFTSYSSSLMEIVSLAASGGSITFTTVSTVAELKAGTYCVSDSDGKLTVAVNQAYTYTITLKLYDTNNYEWSSTDDTTVSFSFRCIVGKTSFTVSITGWTYNTTGTSNTPVISNASNFDSGSATFTYYYYTGTVDDFEADFGSGVDINELTITQPTAAGNYVIYAVLVGTESYASSVAYSGFTISRAEVTAPTATGDGSVDYDGTSHSLAVSGYASGTIEYSYSGSTSISGSTITISETNAGEYVITLSLIDDDNYYWSTDDYATDFDNKSAAISFTLIINKVTVTLIVTANNTTYGSVTDPTWSAADELTELVKSAVTVAYTGTTNSSTAYSSSTAPAVAGTYTVTLTLDETNFNLGSSSTTSAEYTINRQAVETAPSIYSGDTDYTKTLYYNTKEQSVTVMNITTNVMTVDGKTAGSMSTTISGTTVGTYTVVIGLADSANYEWASSITTNNSAYNSANYTLTYSLIIDKLALDAPTLSTSSFTYTGSTISVVDYIGGSYDSSIMNYTSATGSTYEAVNVDSYSLIFTLTETTNYKWADPDTESGTTVTVTWEIVKSGSSTTVVLTVTISGWEYGATTTSTPSYTFTDNDEEVNVDSNITYEYYGTSNNGEWSYTNTAGSRSTEAPTLAGTYYVVAILSGHNNYDNITSAACSFTISRATITLSETNGSDTYDGTTKTLSVTGYNSAAIGYEITTNSPNDGTSTASAALNGTTQVDLTAIAAGTYTITFTLTDTANYTIDGTNEFTLTISRQKITVTITAAGGTYNGNAYSATAEANEVSLSGNDFVYTYDGILTTSYGSTDEAPTGAGSYRVTVTLTTANGYNYEFATTQSKEFTIDKASITLTAGTATYTYTNEVNSLEVSNYNSAALSYEITTNNANDGSTDEAKASDSGTTVTMTATKAGEYVLTFTLTDTANYTLDGANAFTLTINRATITLSGEDVSGTYDGDTKSLSIAGKVEDSDLDFDALSSVLSYNGITNNPNDGTSSASAALNGNYQVDLTATAAGTYTITFTLTDTANYTIDGTNEFTLTISRQQITVTITADGGTYSGNAYAATAEVNDGVELLNDSLVYTYVGILGTDYTSTTTAPSGAGYYTVTVTLANGNNYEFADTQSTEFTISKASITLTADETALTYTGSAQGIFVTGTVSSTAIDFATYVTSNNVLSFAASGTGNDSSSTSTAAINTSDSTKVDLTATAAGTYTITFTLTDGDNYTLDGTSAFTLTINRATVALPTATSYSIAYTGSEIDFVTGYVTLDANYSSIISYNGTDSVPTATEVGNHTVIFVLSSYANYMWAGGSTSDYSMTWTIVSGGVVTIEFTSSTLTYIYGQTIAIEYTVKLGATTVSGATSTVYYLVDGSYTTAAPSAVGEYTVRVEVDATSEYDRTITTTTLTINQQTVTLEYDGSEGINITGWTYGSYSEAENALTYEVTSDVSTYDTDTIGLDIIYTGTTNGDVPYESTTAPTEAGKYTVTITLADDKNFVLNSSYTKDFEIGKATISVSGNSVSADYDSLEHSITLTYLSEVIDVDELTYSVTVAPDLTEGDGYATLTATVADTYTISFTLTTSGAYNYELTGTTSFTLTITTKSSTLDTSGDTISSLKYSDANGLVAEVTNYNAAAGIIEDDLWYYSETSADKIAAHWATVVKSALGDIATYEETIITYKYYGDANDSDSWSYTTSDNTTTTVPTLAGTYYVIITVTNSSVGFSTSNASAAKAKLASASLTGGLLKSAPATVNEITLTATFDIEKLGVATASTNANVSETYTGSIYAIELTGYDSTSMTYVVTDADGNTGSDTAATIYELDSSIIILATQADTYTVTFTIRDTNNYKWAKAAGASAGGEVVFKLAIAKAAVVVPTMTDATSGTITKEVVYNGSEQTATITGYNSSVMSITTTSDYSISGTTITLKGTSAASYTLTLSISDTNTTNYYWANGVSDPTFTLTISALEVTVTVTADTSTYGSVTVPSVTTSDSLVDSYISVLYTGTVNGGTANGYSSATAPTEAGEYTVTLTLTDGDNFSLSSDSVMEVSYKIERLAIALPEISGNVLTYNGAAQSATVTGYDSILMTVTGDCTEYSDKLVISGTNAADYSVTVSLTDTNNYKWVDDAGNPTFTLTINALEVKVTVTATDSTYGNVTVPSIITSTTLVDSYISVLYTGTVNGGTANGYSSATAPTEAGEYTVTLTLTNTNNFTLSGSSVMSDDFTIERATITLSGDNASYVYSGSANALTIGADGYNTEGISYSVSSNAYSGVAASSYYNGTSVVVTATDAGTYTLTFKPVDSNNYTISGTTSYTLTISKQTVTVPTASGSTNVTFDGSAHQLVIATYDSKTMSVSGTATASGSSLVLAGTDAGTYTVTISLSDTNNYEWASGGSNPTFTLTITSAGNAISGLANVSTIYGTSYNAETGSANFGTITYLYTGTTNGGVTYSSSVAPTEAGSYTLTATVTGNNNYAGATASITIIIGKLAVALPEISGNVLTYNGAAQSATVTGYDSAVMNVTGDCTEYGNSIVITGTAAGDYSVTVALSDTNNYEWATTGSTTYTLTINALEVTITVTANDSVYGSVELPEVTTSSTLADSNITVLYTGTANDGSAYESATAPTEAGEYSITLTLTDLDNLTLSADSILEASFVIERLAVALPEISGNVLTYNGTAQSATVTGYDSAVMNVTGDCTEYGNSIVITGTAAGDYSVTVALSDTNNYEWATTGSTTYTLTINALEVTITVTATDSVYGSVELPEVTTSSTLADSNITVLYTGTVNDGSAYESATAPTEAGEYSITLTLTDLDNLTLSADSILEASYTIARKVVTLSGEDVTAVYDGTIHTLEVTGYDANAMAYVLDGTSYSGKDATSTASGTMVYVMASDAGEYTLTFELTDANNYTLDGVAEYALTISKATVALPVTGSETAVTYDGTAHLLEISGFNTAAMGYAYSGSVSISGDVITVSETHAGEYAITFSLKDTDNYVWADNAEDPVFSLTIAKATANGIEWSGDILLVYGTSYDAETATATYGNIVYAYYVQGETTALGSAPSDVGVYTVTATVAGTDDYVGATASITITINKAEILIEIPEITGNVLTYTGEAQSATITGYDSKLLGATGEGVDFYVAYNNSIIITETDAGSYTVTVYIIDTLNYMWSDGTTGAKTYTLTINRMAIDTPVTADGNITYDAASHTFTVTGYDAELMSYAYDGEVTADGSELTISATNAGTYTITFGFNTTNYCWSGTGSDEYTISWTIDKLVLTVPTSSSSSFISGNESTYIPEGFDETWMDIEGNTASEAGDYTATVTLKDTENCVWANGTTDSISISWSISHRFTAGHIIMGVIIAILVALLVTLIVRAVIIKKKHSKNEGEENK